MENCYRESDNDANGDTENVHVNRRVGLTNPHVKSLSEDHLYHIGLNNKEHDLQKLFGDIKFVCFGGQPSRMEIFASYLIKELDLDVGEPKNYAETTDRYAVYKAGPVLSVSHGIGIPSLSIVFQEIIKLLHYSGCEDVTFFRIGTSGGIGLEGGNVVVSDRVVNGALQPEYQAEQLQIDTLKVLAELTDCAQSKPTVHARVCPAMLKVHLCSNILIVLGKCIPRPAPVDRTLANELHACAKDTDDFNTVLGTTLCADDFYEGQGRVDGAFCDHDDGDKFEWLRSVKEKGVTNIEMESLGFIALCHRARVRGAVCCVSLLDRLHGDGLTMNKQQLIKWQTHPQILVARYIKQKLNKG